jgi:hypothetical protein
VGGSGLRVKKGLGVCSRSLCHWFAINSER